MILRVALDVPLNKLFDYRCEQNNVCVGDYVVVSFGRRKLIGIVIEISDHSSLPQAQLKNISGIASDIPALATNIIELVKFCANYYHHPIGQALLSVLPPSLRNMKRHRREQNLTYLLTAAGDQISLDDFPARASTKRALLDRLKQQGQFRTEDLSELPKSAKRILKDFVASGWVSESSETLSDDLPLANLKKDARPVLNEEQQKAVHEILQSFEFKVWLLHGITGSGKTEVYLHLIEEILQRNGQVLVLVPEINLTPQLQAHFQRRFPQAKLVSLHSALSAAERAQNWLDAQLGKAHIVLGTRLAIFTAMPRLALIVVDEEHDASFKQQEGFRYSARDVAVARAQRDNIPIVLGSATPSLESFYNAQINRYKLLELHRRAVPDAQMPTISCIATRDVQLFEGLSESLISAIRQRLQRREQSLIFINRRGFSPVLLCTECGWIACCEHCSTRLVWHAKNKRLRCHRCGFSSRVPRQCPTCASINLTSIGYGTQRVETTLAKLFPDAAIMRIDSDVTRQKHSLQNKLEEIRHNRIDILVGTQLLAKGHDFPNLTLVGVLGADDGLYSADFRASERLFAQLTQVSGRAGRGNKPGQVLIQTDFPNHPLFLALMQEGYSDYAQTLLTERKQAQFPPYCFQALLRAESTLLEKALSFLEEMLNVSRKLNYPVNVFDPVSAPISRIRGKERAYMLVQAQSRSALQAFLNEWLDHLPKKKDAHVRWSIDVDPLDLL